MGSLFTLILTVQAEVFAAQSPRDLERQHDEIMRAIAQQDSGRAIAVNAVQDEIRQMKNGIESKLLPPLEKIARELELDRTAKRQEDQLDVSAQVASLAGNVTLVLVGIVLGISKALAMFGGKEKE